jgi:hypothetical protein
MGGGPPPVPSRRWVRQRCRIEGVPGARRRYDALRKQQVNGVTVLRADDPIRTGSAPRSPSASVRIRRTRRFSRYRTNTRDGWLRRGPRRDSTRWYPAGLRPNGTERAGDGADSPGWPPEGPSGPAALHARVRRAPSHPDRPGAASRVSWVAVVIVEDARELYRRWETHRGFTGALTSLAPSGSSSDGRRGGARASSHRSGPRPGSEW